MLRDEEKEALRLVTQVLMDIRLACDLGKCTPETLSLTRDLASSVHNLPTIIAREGTKERNQLDFILNLEKDAAARVYLAFDAQSSGRLSPMRLQEMSG